MWFINLMLRACIVDDERLATERLTRLLDATGRARVAGSTTDPETALAELRDREVDLLFLDIQMRDLTGFDLVERLERDLPVIFTTAYDRYALDAFAVNSIDYFLNPIESERLERAWTNRRASGSRGRMSGRWRASSPRSSEQAGGSSGSPPGSGNGRRCSRWRASATSSRKTS